MKISDCLKLVADKFEIPVSDLIVKPDNSVIDTRTGDLLGTMGNFNVIECEGKMIMGFEFKPNTSHIKLDIRLN